MNIYALSELAEFDLSDTERDECLRMLVRLYVTGEIEPEEYAGLREHFKPREVVVKMNTQHREEPQPQEVYRPPSRERTSGLATGTCVRCGAALESMGAIGMGSVLGGLCAECERKSRK